ncbi:MAG: 3-hydroxyacyl-CoA dehydrogenase NAD-binding domain-containing protein, partial [Phycisphaerales bacterium]|nr:3-hydroxyacyl-CoA dehydrogenase NAD-binding domain-containing protein [Phycisphaerales bacterium]
MSAARHPIGIVGTGTMGAGIAQIAATSGWPVMLMDVDEPTVRKAIDGIQKRLDRQVEKGLMTAGQRKEALARLKIGVKPETFKDCDLVIEAVVEDLALKTTVLGRVMRELPKDAVIATNTSSLSIGKIGEALGAAQRVVGLHFFNPAP